MISRKYRFLSGLLSFIMVLMVVVEILPPVPVYAASKPTVQTLSATDITSSSALLRGKVTTNGGVLIEEYGFGVKINGGSWKYPYREYEHIDSGEIVSYEYDDLEPGDSVEYYFYAINSVGESSASGNYKKFVVPSEIEVNTDYLEFDADGGKDTFKIYADSAYTIVENLSWISLSSTSGSSDKTITVTCSKNTSSSDREGVIKVKDTSTGDTLEIEVWQDGAVIYATMSSYKLSSYEVEVGEQIKLSGTISGNGETIKAIQVTVFDSDDHGKGGKHYSASPNSSTYSLSNVPAIVAGATVGSTSFKTEAGKSYDVVVYATLSNGKGFETDPEKTFDVVKTKATISGYSLSSYEVEEGEQIKLSGTISGNGETIKAIQVTVFDSDDHGKGGKHYSATPNSSTYSLSNVPAIVTGTTVGSTSFKTVAGKSYDVVVYATLSNGEGFETDPEKTFDVVEKTYASISNFSLSSYEVEEGEQIKLSGTISGNGKTIKAIQVTVFDADDHGKGGKHYSATPNSSTYSLSNVPAIVTGTTVGSTSFKTVAGKSYDVVVYATLSNSNGFKSDPTATFDVLTNDFSISSIKPSVNTVNTQVGVDFTVTTNSAVKNGIDIYAGEYHLARITSGTKSGNQIIYTYKGHKFTSAGVKTIYAYPVTAGGEPDKSVKSSCEITVNAPYGRIGNPEFTTANNQTIAVDESFSVAWNKPTAPSSGITYNVYVMKAGTNENEVVKEGITSSSCSIPASFFKDEGRYVITVYALASGYAQNATGATLVVNVKSDDSVYVMSVTPSATDTKTLTDVDFTIKTSTSAKYGVAIYAGKYHLATVEKKTSSSGYIKYVYEDHNFTSGGVKNIYVYPLDASGKIIQDEGTYATCSIQVTATSACGAPSITTATNQTISFNSDFKVAWTKPSVPSSGVKYNVYVRHSYTEDGEPLDNADRVVNSSMITSTSLTIDSSYFTEKGSYTITVYAMAPGYTQSSPAAITVYVTDGYRLQVNAKELTAYEGGGKGNNITVTANMGWSVSSDVNWISFNTSSGNGNGQFYPIIDANDSAEERSGNIIVSGGGITRKILVKQGGVLINTSAQEDSVYNQPTSQLRVTVKEIQEIPTILTRTVMVSNATVTYGNTTVKTDKDGIAVVPYDVQSGDSLVVSKSGYSTQTIEAKWLSVNQGGIEVTLNPLNDKNEPTINAVWVLGSNILKESYSVDLFSTHSISFTADVDWGNDSYGSISLWQNGKQIKFNGNKLQTVLSEKFDVSQAIYIVAINASGKETREKLNLKSGGGYPDWLNKMQINFADKFSVTLPSSAGIFAGAKIGIDFNGLTKIIPISVIVEGNKVYASIGVELVKGSKENGYLTSYEVSYGKNEIKTIKDTINKYKNSGNASPKKFFDTLKQRYSNQLEYPGINFILSGKVNVIGYVEGYLDSSGNLVLLDNGLILNPSVSANWGGTFTVPVAPMVPLVWEVLLKGDFKFITNLYVDQKAKDFTSQGEVKGDITVNGGLGVGVNNVASVTGGVEGVLKANYVVYRDGSDYFKLDAGIGLYGKIKVAIFEHTFRTPKAETTLYENPAPQTYRMYALANEEASMLGDYSDTSVYELQNREYLNYYSGFTMNENENVAPYALARTFSMRSDISTDKTTVFYENIYPNAEPVIGTFDDGTMIAVYIGDDTTRIDINRTRLYYSFYNGIEWSQPVPVDANGKTADFAPSLVIAQNKAFITWQDATKTFSNSDSLESIAPYFDISIAVFDPTNKNIVTHTIEYTGLDMIPSICANDNNVSVVWVNNALNDWYGCNNTNSILSYTYTDNGWGNVVNLKSSLTSVRSIDAQYIGNVLNTIYSIDTDNNVETVTDINTYLLRNSSNSIINSNSGIVNSAIIRNGTIYWQENGNIMYCDVNNLSVVNSIFSSDVTYSINTYDVLDNGYEKYAILVIGDGLYSKLGISVFDDSSMTWSDIVYITDGSNMVSDYDAVITSDGFVRVIATQTAVLGDMSSSNPYGLSDIIICDVYINGDLTVEDVTFDMSKTVGDTTAEVYAHVVNNGKETIDSSVISIYDRNWNLISTSIDETEIKPGAEATLIAYMDIDDAIIGSDVIVVVKPRGINDVNQTDNSIEVTINYFDVAVEQIAYGMKSDGKAVIYANIVNRGYRTENNITAYLRKGSADASIIASTQVSSLSMFDLIPVQFTVSYEEGAVYYITISENDGDMMTSNNQDFVVLSDNSDTDEYLIGDVNLDGSVTIDDATLLLQHVAKITTITDDVALANAEVTGDGTVTIDDATKLLQYVAKIIGSLD